jgi:hypothetical protein
VKKRAAEPNELAQLLTLFVISWLPWKSITLAVWALAEAVRPSFGLFFLQKSSGAPPKPKAFFNYNYHLFVNFKSEIAGIMYLGLPGLDDFS